MAQKFYTNIEILSDVTQPKHAATKEYVDLVFSRKIKDAVVDVIGENIIGSYDAGSKKLTQTTPAKLVTANAVELEVDNRVLLVGQTSASQNGIYVVETVGESDGTVAVLKRAGDFDDTADLTLNLLIPVSADDSMWTLTNDDMPTLDTSNLTFQKFSGEEGVSGFIGEFVGDNSKKDFTIVHGLGTKRFVSSITNEDNEVCVFSVKAESDTAVKVHSDVTLTNGQKFYITVLAKV